MLQDCSAILSLELFQSCPAKTGQTGNRASRSSPSLRSLDCTCVLVPMRSVQKWSRAAANSQWCFCSRAHYGTLVPIPSTSLLYNLSRFRGWGGILEKHALESQQQLDARKPSRPTCSRGRPRATGKVILRIFRFPGRPLQSKTSVEAPAPLGIPRRAFCSDGPVLNSELACHGGAFILFRRSRRCVFIKFLALSLRASRSCTLVFLSIHIAIDVASCLNGALCIFCLS